MMLYFIMFYYDIYTHVLYNRYIIHVYIYIYIILCVCVPFLGFVCEYVCDVISISAFWKVGLWDFGCSRLMFVEVQDLRS